MTALLTVFIVSKCDKHKVLLMCRATTKE